MMQSGQLECVFTPPSWCSITDVEIVRRVGQLNIEDMHLIQLMHPEYQINNKPVVKKVLANAKIYNKVADKRY